MRQFPNLLRSRGRRWGLVLLVLVMLVGATASVATAFNGGSIPPGRWGISACPRPESGVHVEESVCLTGLVNTPQRLTVEELQALGNTQTIETTYVSGRGESTHTFKGVPLLDVVNEAGNGLILNPDQKNDKLSKYMVFTAWDDYEVIVSWGEIDPGFENKNVLIAWEQDGKALEGEDGPVRLVVPGDIHGGRYVHGVHTIEVRDVDSATRPNHIEELFKFFSRR